MGDDAAAPATLPHGGQFRATAEVLSFFQGLGAAWDPFGSEVEAIGEVAPGLVAGVVHASGTLRDDGEGSYGAVHLFTVQDGKITRFRDHVDVDWAVGG